MWLKIWTCFIHPCSTEKTFFQDYRNSSGFLEIFEEMFGIEWFQSVDLSDSDTTVIPDTQVQSSQNRDTQVQDTEVQDTQVRDTQVQDTQVYISLSLCINVLIKVLNNNYICNQWDLSDN